MDGAQLVRRRLGVRQPFTVGRPGAYDVAVAHLIGVLGDLDLLLRLQVYVPKTLEAVHQGDSFAVWGQPRGTVEARFQLDFRNLARAALRPHGQSGLARLVRTVGDALAVRRPLRLTFHDARRIGQISRVALFSRHGDDLAARGKYGASTVRRERRCGKAPPDVDEPGAQFRKIALHANCNGFGLAGLQLVEGNPAELLIHDRIRPERGGLHVQRLIRNGFADRFGLRVVGEERRRPIAVRRALDAGSGAHGGGVVVIRARHLGYAAVREAREPEARGLPAAIFL